MTKVNIKALDYKGKLKTQTKLDKETKEILKILAEFFFGITLFILFIDQKGNLIIFTFVGFLFLILSFIRLFDFIHGKKTDLKKLISEIIVVPFIYGGFIGLIFAGFQELSKTINGYNLFFELGSYGFVFGIFIEVLIYRFKSTENRKFNFGKLFASSLIFYPLLFISIGSLINRYKTKKITTPIESIVLEKECEIDKKDKNKSQYRISTNAGNYGETFYIKPELWNNLQKNDTILLFIEKGYLGYDIVEHIEKETTADNKQNYKQNE